MSIKAYNAFFTEPPQNSNNNIGISYGEHPAIISLFKPSTNIITSVFVLVKNETLTANGEIAVATKTNRLKLSIIDLDSANSYLPTYHDDAVAEAIRNQNSYDTYITELHDNSLSGVVTKTNINFSGTQTWIEFRFTAGFITNVANELDPNRYYGILISDTSKSVISNKIFHSDKTYGQSSLNRTLYLTTDDGDITWQNYQTGDNNVQICLAYPKDQLSASNSLSYGSISTGGTNYKRNTGIGMFVRNTSSSDQYFINNFVLTPDDGDEDIGLEAFTYNSAFPWTYFDKNTLPSTSAKTRSGKTASTGLNIELAPDDFVFLYQRDWIAPVPVKFLTKSAVQTLFSYALTGDSLYMANNGYNFYTTMENPAKQFDYHLIKLHNENHTNLIANGNYPISKVFSTDYPGISISSDDLQEIKINQILKDENGDITYNSFEANPFSTDKFINSMTGLNFDDDFFEDKTYYMNSSVERSDWKEENNLNTVPLREYNSTGMLKSHGIPINSDSSNSEKIVFNNNRIFPNNEDGANVTDVRNIVLSYHSDSTSSNKFKVTRNNTINIEGMRETINPDNSLKYRLVYQHSHEDDNFPWPPHLILRNYPSGSVSQNLTLGGVCFYTGSYSNYQENLNLATSEVQSGTISPSRTSIIDSNLGTYELPIAKTDVSDATNVYGKGFSLTIHQNSNIDPDSTTNGFYDQKYIIRHIVDNIITIEGKVLAYGLCTTVHHPETETVETTLINVSSSDFEDWSSLTTNPNYRLSVNPFGFLFNDFNLTDGSQTVGKIYNDGDPIKLMDISSFDTSTGIITSSNVSSYFWSKLFLTNYDETTYHQPHFSTIIPFYIIETPKGTLIDASSEMAGMVGTPYGAANPKWVGDWPDYFEIGGQIYSSGYHVAGRLDPSRFYIHKLGLSHALLPMPENDASVGYSITFPYIENINDLSGLSWLSTLFSGLGTDMTNIDINEDDVIDVYDNPCEKFRAQKIDASSYHKYHIVDPLSNVNNPENIYKTTEYTEFKNINDCAQIHISGVSTLADPIIKYKYLSFIYSLGENNTGISSTCELSLNAHNDNFILEADDLLIDLIPSIVLNSGGSSGISNSFEAIYSHEFNSPVDFNDYILKRTGGDSSVKINNLVMFNDVVVYGKCINPINIWRNRTDQGFCKLPSNGYIIIDLGYSRYVNYLEFMVSQSEDEVVPFEEGEVEFIVSGLDPNTSDNFYEINKPTSYINSKISSNMSFIKTNINRTVKYILIQTSFSSSSVYLQNLKVQIENLDVYCYDTLLYNRHLFLPAYTAGATDSSDSVITYPVAQPRNYKYATYPYDHTSIFSTIDPYTTQGLYGTISTDDNRYNSLYIPVGKTTNETPNLFITGITLSDIITTSNAITQISFNVKRHKGANLSPSNSYLFKLYSSEGTNPGGGGDLIDSGFTLRHSIMAVPYSREPEEGFYTISSIGENIIYIDSTDIIFANNNLQGYLARVDIFRDIYVEVTSSGITSSGQAWIEIKGATGGLDLIVGGQMYLERSNVLSFPAFKATWLKLEYVNTMVPVDIFGLKVYTSILDSNNDPVDVTAFTSLSWNLQINHIQD